MLNCLSFDIEGFVESNIQSISIDPSYIDRSKEVLEIENNTRVILDLLDETGCKATFYILASVTRDLPSVVKTIADKGHEIALHGPEHIRVFDCTRRRFTEQLIAAKKALEDVSSSSVRGFRAPDFSITKASLWALDVLKESGFLYDSSIFPIGIHDVYGIEEAQPNIHRLPNGLIEFPPSTVALFGRRLPFGGGGYFRLYPMFLTDALIRRTNRLGEPCNLYLHPYEVGSVIPHIPTLSRYRKFRHYHNCNKGHMRLRHILSRHKCGTAIEVLEQQGFGETTNV